MTTWPVIYDANVVQSQSIWRRGGRYFWLALLCYLLLALIVVAYLMRTPSFSSAHALVLPGSGSSSNFNIEDVGTANQSTRTPFAGAEFSPLANYREIVKSRDVRQRAALKLGVALEQVPPVQVKLRQRTSIVEVNTLAGSPESAQQLGWAVYESFQEALDELREDEVARRDLGVQRVLERYSDKVAETRAAIVRFQERALLISSDQMDQLASSITDLNNKRIDLVATSENTKDYVRQLGQDLGISPSMAGHAFALQSDAAFRGYLKELDASASLVAEYSSRWGDKHPKVIAQTLRYDSAREMLKQRSYALVGDWVSDGLQTADLQSAPKRAELFADLVNQYAKLKGTMAEVAELDRAMAKMDDRLKIYSREVAELERLEREHALAEAVFTSAAAKLEASKADIFASYPAVQLLSVPSLPQKPKNPNPIIAAAIGAVGFLFISFGLLALWHRSRLIKLVLKNA